MERQARCALFAPGSPARTAATRLFRVSSVSITLLWLFSTERCPRLEVPFFIQQGDSCQLRTMGGLSPLSFFF